jgi:transcriptional regulator with XRE-family HTH domain
VSGFEPTTNVPAEVLAGQNIRQWRHSRALELTDLARLAGLTVELLAGVEAGHEGALCLDDLDRLATALAVPPITLLATLNSHEPNTFIKT